MNRRRAHDEKGQTLVEFALVVPLLCVLLFAIIQFGVVFNHYVTVTDAARAGARKAAVSRFIGDQGASAEETAVESAANLDEEQLEVDCSSTDWDTPGSDVECTVSYPYSINVLGWVVSDGSLSSTTKERLE